jgi:hypothetical protein
MQQLLNEWYFKLGASQSLQLMMMVMMMMMITMTGGVAMRMRLLFFQFFTIFYLSPLWEGRRRSAYGAE